MYIQILYNKKTISNIIEGLNRINGTNNVSAIKLFEFETNIDNSNFETLQIIIFKLPYFFY
jgi:hypothetical protein